MRFVRASLFNVYFFGLTVLEALILWPFAFTGRGPARLVARLWCWQARLGLKAIVGMDLRIAGREHLPDGPCILVVKHQSAFETVMLHTLMDNPAFVLKRELTAIPVFGWYLGALGQVAVDRGAGVRALKEMVSQVGARLKEGRRIVIFPEGTRTPPGADRPYHPGIYALYKAYPDVPMIPVALNSGVFWGRRSYLKTAGTVTIRYLPPLEKDQDRKTFMAGIKRTIDAASDRLVAEARDDVTGRPRFPRSARH